MGASRSTLVTEIDFVDGDEASDAAAQNYQKHLSDTQGLSLRNQTAPRGRERRGANLRNPAGD